jgi:hypothetical protein
MSEPSDTARDDPFFIGWLPMPACYRRFLAPLAALLVVVAAGTAAGVALLQSDPGAGRWESDRTRTFDGLLLAAPYAMLRVPGESAHDPPRTLLLVEEGKFGALPRVLETLPDRSAGLAVRARGTLLHRDGRGMLELAAGEESLRRLTDTEQRRLPHLALPMPVVIHEEVTLHGEIIDPKCYLGAMKPGGGKTHKGCAALCLRGGVPPMLVTRGSSGQEVYHLLVTAEGEPAGDVVVPFVGDAVSVRGRLEKRGDLLRLAIAPQGIGRR